MTNKIPYHISAVARNSLEDWFLTFYHGRGRLHKVRNIDRNYTLRFHGLKGTSFGLRRDILRRLDHMIRASPNQKGYVCEEAYLSEQDILTQLGR